MLKPLTPALSVPDASPSQLYFARLQSVMSALDFAQMDRAIHLIQQAWLEGRQIITLGNGGSALTALHFITDWNKSLFAATGRPFRGRSLLDNVGLLSALGNDVDYDSVFAQQLAQIAQPGDLVIAISGSGKSKNILRAVETAHDLGCVTLGLCGFDGGALKDLAQHQLWIAADNMQICEDLHMIFGHVVMQALCGALAAAPVLDTDQQVARLSQTVQAMRDRDVTPTQYQARRA